MNTIIPNKDAKINFTVDKFFKNIKIGYILKQCNFSKENGIPCIAVFKFIFLLVFTGKNIYRTLELNCNINFAKDTVYRFLNSSRFN